MNIAAFVSGPIIDALAIGFKDGISIGKVQFSSYRLLIFTTTFTSICSFVVTYSSLREINVELDQENNRDSRGRK